MASTEFREPMLATLADTPVVGDDWMFERKLDGIRLVAVRDGDEVALWTRNRINRVGAYPEVVEALLDQPIGRFIVDGEVVAFDDGQTSFERLQQRMGIDNPTKARATGVEVHFYAFDLLHLDGHDLENLDLRSRKRFLTEAFDYEDPLRLSEVLDGDGSELLAAACDSGWEGLIAKRADSTYTHGRSRQWLKLKCVRTDDFVIGGYTDPKGARSGFGSLLVGFHDGDDFVFAGKVGSGFDERILSELSARFVEIDDCPFDREAPTGRDLHWVAPEITCEVGYGEWTNSGKLRHPRFLRLKA